MDAQHFAVRFAFQRGGLAQRVGDGDQVLALVEAIRGVFTRAILEALDLGQGVPPQVFGLVGRVDDGVWQAVVAVEVFGGVTEGVDFGDVNIRGRVAFSASSTVNLLKNTHSKKHYQKNPYQSRQAKQDHCDKA